MDPIVKLVTTIVDKIPNNELDKIIAGQLEGLDPKKVDLVKKRSALSGHKRCTAEIFKRG